MMDTVLSGEEIRDRIGRRPRLRLAVLPTPLQPCPRLSAEVGVDVWVKRDDLTGLAFGGNKIRHFELIFADPPYRFDAYDETILACESLLVPGGQIAIEHGVAVDLPDRVGRLQQHDKRVYGDSAISFYSGSSE